jgi:hypothetical protein
MRALANPIPRAAPVISTTLSFQACIEFILIFHRLRRHKGSHAAAASDIDGKGLCLESDEFIVAK